MLARGSAPWILAPLILALAAMPWSRAASAGLVGVAILLVWFHRDPDRAPKGAWVAPADGRVLRIEPAGDGTRIVTFLSPLDVHVIRAPCHGSIRAVERVGRGHRPAYHADADHNAGVVIHLASEAGPVRLSLLAGAVARRARSWVRPGQVVRAGERVGMIQLGSRVDLDLPAGLRPAVLANKRVHAGDVVATEGPP